MNDAELHRELEEAWREIRILQFQVECLLLAQAIKPLPHRAIREQDEDRRISRHDMSALKLEFPGLTNLSGSGEAVDLDVSIDYAEEDQPFFTITVHRRDHDAEPLALIEMPLEDGLTLMRFLGFAMQHHKPQT